MSSEWQWHYRPRDRLFRKEGTLEEAWRVSGFPKPPKLSQSEPFACRVSPRIQLTLDRYLTAVRRGTRRRCFVAQLPPELLMEIFSYLPWASALRRIHCDPLVVDLQSLSSLSPSPQPFVDGEHCILDQIVADGCVRFCRGYRSWLSHTILRVCKTWRDIAYSCPQFWCRIPLFDEVAACRAIELSTNKPIYVIDDGDWPRLKPPALLVALTVLQRIRELKVSRWASNSDYAGRIEALISQPAPQLEHLELSHLPNYIPDYILFGQALPRLLSLKLLGLIPSPNSFLYAPTLTYLDISSEHRLWDSSDEFIDTLSRMPLLKEIHLSHGINIFPPDLVEPHFQPTHDPLCLSHVHALSTGGTYISLPNLLGILTLPALTTLCMRFSHDDGDPAENGEAASRCFSFFTNYFNRGPLSGRSFSRAHFHIDYFNDQITFSFSGQVPSISPSCPLYLIRIDHFDMYGPNFYERLKFASYLALLIPAHNVTDLTIQQTYCIPAELDSAKLWRLLPVYNTSTVRHILFRGDAAKDFLYWFSKEEASRNFPYYPSLESIAIKECHIDDLAGVLSPVPSADGNTPPGKRYLYVRDLIEEHWDWRKRAQRPCTIHLLKSDLNGDKRRDLFRGLERRFGKEMIQCLEEIKGVSSLNL
jgi:hypothetical protein